MREDCTANATSVSCTNTPHGEVSNKFTSTLFFCSCGKNKLHGKPGFETVDITGENFEVFTPNSLQDFFRRTSFRSCRLLWLIMENNFRNSVRGLHVNFELQDSSPTPDCQAQDAGNIHRGHSGLLLLSCGGTANAVHGSGRLLVGGEGSPTLHSPSAGLEAVPADCRDL